MASLSPNDFVKISAFTQAVYAETDISKLPVTMLKGLRKLIAFEHCSYNEINSATNETVGVLFPHIPEVFKLLPAFEVHASEHPIIANFRDQKLPGSCKTTDFLTQRQFREMGIYRDFFRHVDTENQLSCQLSDPGAVCDIAIAINRKKGDFAERDRAILNFLRPHMVQARRNAVAFAEAQRKTLVLTETLDLMSFGVVALTSQGKIAWVTGKATEFFDRYFPGQVGNSNRLPDALDRWVKATRVQLDPNVVANRPVGPYVLQGAEGRLTVRFTPDADGSVRLLLSEERVRPSGETVRVTGLTARENEVLHWIALGKSNPEIGKILGVSSRTVDKHTQHIFEKMGVENRAAAMRQVLSGER